MYSWNQLSHARKVVDGICGRQQRKTMSDIDVLRYYHEHVDLKKSVRARRIPAMQWVHHRLLFKELIQ